MPDASVRGEAGRHPQSQGVEREVYLSLFPFSIFLGGIFLGDIGITGPVEKEDLLPLDFQVMGRSALKSP